MFTKEVRAIEKLWPSVAMSNQAKLLDTFV